MAVLEQGEHELGLQGPAQPSLWSPWPGPRLPKTQLVLAVNWKGINFLDQRERTVLELSFPEITSLVTDR